MEIEEMIGKMEQMIVFYTTALPANEFLSK